MSTRGVVLPSTLYKPAGIPVFPRHAAPSDDCLMYRLRTERPDQFEHEWPEGFEGGIAHRLDISTSGAVVVAADPRELVWLRRLFQEKRLVKTYRLLVAKQVSWDTNVCDRDIAHDRNKRSRMIVARGHSTPHRGKWLPAKTEFKRLQGSLFEATMRSGVMHQIRVHAAFLGIPLLGDRLYGGGAPPPDTAAGVQFFLHHVGLHCSEFESEALVIPAWAE